MMTNCRGGLGTQGTHRGVFSIIDLITTLLLFFTQFQRNAASDLVIIQLPDLQAQEEPISCFGPLPPFKLPQFHRRTPYRDDIYDANTFTLQELCAKAGGKPANQNAGGICDASTDEVWFNGPRYQLRESHIASDPRGDALFRSKHSPLETARIKLYCQMRCVCNRLLTPGIPPRPPPRPWGPLGLDHGKLCLGSLTFRLEDLEWSAEDRSTKVLFLDAPKLSVKTRFQHWVGTEAEYQFSRWYRFCIRFESASEIKCKDREPGQTNFPFTLPRPFTMADFPTDQRICANALSGGNRNANAGGYCHRSEPQPDVWFSDEVTPWLGWTWENLRESAALRFYCWTRCRCFYEWKEPRSRPMNLLWYYLSQTQAMLNIDPQDAQNLLQAAQEQTPNALRNMNWQFRSRSTLSYTKQGDLYLSYENSKKITLTLPLADVDGKLYPWPTDLLGPIDQTKDLYALPLSPPSVSHPGLELSQCGNTCHGMSDCTSASLDQSIPCRCVLATDRLKALFNLDAIFPAPGLCLTAAAMATVAQSMLNQVPGRRGMASEDLLGRDLKLIEEEKEEVPGLLSCLCNATFAAVECCVSETGYLVS